MGSSALPTEVGSRAPGDTPLAGGIGARALLIGLALWLLVAVVLSAWIADDALITFRTLDHWVEGRGLRFNPGERVQAFTHPLWLFALLPAYVLTGEALVGPIALGLVCLAGVLLLVFKWARTSSREASLLVLALLSSKAFVDYSTSGLENPLTHLLIAAFAWLFLNREPWDITPARVRGLALVSSMLFLNRMDAVLLVAPACLLVGWDVVRAGRLREMLGPVAVALAPAVAWICFALIYYGSPLPNTAYAKLGTGIPRSELLLQGVRYLQASAHFDLATLVLIAAGVVLGGALGGRRLRALSLGLALAIGYVVYIGGDFMVGRFLSAPALLSAVILASLAMRSRLAVAAIGVAFAVAWVTPTSPVRALPTDLYVLDERGREIAATGIVDERLYYYAQTGLLSPSREAGLVAGSACRAVDESPRIIARNVCGDLGRRGFDGCFSDHLVDPCALTDAFLARQPVADPLHWRIGHFVRNVPLAYVASLESGMPSFADDALNCAFVRTRAIVSGPVFSEDRLRAWMSRCDYAGR